MQRSFWVWNPVCSGSYRRFDEPYAYQNNRWMFDKSVWQKMFRAMSGSGFDSFFLANTHPFPFMIRQRKYPEARMLSDQELLTYQEMYHWIFETAGAYDIKPYVLFFSIYYSEPFEKAHGIVDKDSYIPGELAVDYTRSCVEELLQEYPEIAGLVADASENIRGLREPFLCQIAVEPMEKDGRHLIVRGWCSDTDGFRDGVAGGAKIPVTFSVKYTWEHLVGSNPDKMFTDWVQRAGGENVMGEFWISNFEPFTSFSYGAVSGILDHLDRLGCRGFSLHPLSIYEWPFTSDTAFDTQYERDSGWYYAWGGRKPDDAPGFEILREPDIMEGLQTASKILEESALYFGGDRQNQWHPQFASVRHPDGARLFTLDAMATIDKQASQWGPGHWQAFDGRYWWQDLWGQPVAHIPDVQSPGLSQGTMGPEEFAARMDGHAENTLLKLKGALDGNRSPAEKALISNALAMIKLGRFWAARIRGALHHAKGDHRGALEYMQEAYEHFKGVVALEEKRRPAFRVLTGRCALTGSWQDPLDALAAEIKDYRDGHRSGTYYANRTEGRD